MHRAVDVRCRENRYHPLRDRLNALGDAWDGEPRIAIGGKGSFADYNYHKISNQAFYDLAQALGATSVKLGYFH